MAFSLKVLSQQAFNLIFKVPTFRWLGEQVLLLWKLHVSKLMEIGCWNVGGHKSFGQKSALLHLDFSWTRLIVWGGSIVLERNSTFFLNVASIQGNNFSFNRSTNKCYFTLLWKLPRPRPPHKFILSRNISLWFEGMSLLFTT